MLVLEVINSKRDRNGNRYWAISVRNTITDKSASGTISGGDSNARCALRSLFSDWEDYRRSVVETRAEMPIREFQRFTKDLPYAGCANEIAAWIVEQVGEFRDHASTISE